MRRSRNKMRLRGSVTQTVPSVRMRATDSTRLSFLVRFSILAGSLFVIFGILLWLWHIGWPQRQTEKLLDAGLHATQKAQFAVKDIVLDDERHQVSKDALLTALGTVAGAPILSFDPVAAQARIVKLPWVASAIVERHLPDTIVVLLTERVPLARWQHDDKTIIIDSDGAELPEAKLEQFPQLPLVVGADAAGQAGNLLDTLKDYPAILQHMTAAVRVGERRWDIHLQPKIVARLPETNMGRALSKLSDLITDQKILERDIVAIDLRDPSKMVIEPGSSSSGQATGDTRL